MLALLCLIANLAQPSRLPAVLLVFAASYGHQLALGPKPHDGMTYYLGACVADALALVLILTLPRRRFHTRLALVLLCAIAVNALSFVGYELGAPVSFPNMVAIYLVLAAQTLIMCVGDGDGPTPVDPWRSVGVRAYCALLPSGTKSEARK